MSDGLVAVADVDAEKDAYGVVTVVHVLLRLFLLRKEGRREREGVRDREGEERESITTTNTKLLSTIATCISLSYQQVG